jgi:hypothetical protein
LQWWAIDFTGNCEPYYLVLMLQFGMCHTSQSQKATQENGGCIAWDDGAGWDEVDASSGVRTDRAVRRVYPAIRDLTYVVVAVTALQLLMCVVQWKRMSQNKWIQRGVLFCTVITYAISVVISVISANTSVTSKETWKYTNSCSAGSSYPGLGNVVLISVGSTVTIAAMLIVNYPEKMW